MATKQQYSVTVHRGIKLPYRYRAGYQFVKNETNIVSLTDQELDQVKQDLYLEVKPATKKDLDNGIELQKYSTYTDSPVPETESTDTVSSTSQSDTGDSGEGDSDSQSTSTDDQGSDDEGAEDSNLQEKDAPENEDETLQSGDQTPEKESAEQVVYTVDVLKKNFNTTELTALAAERNVEITPEMDTKAKIAEAIVAKQNEG